MDCTGKLSEKITDDVKSYVRLQLDSAKLAAVEGLATVAGKAIGLVICLFLFNIALVFLIGALAYGLGLLINSFVWAAVIMGVLCLLTGVLLFMKPRPFVNSMIRVFMNVFFNKKNCRNYE